MTTATSNDINEDRHKRDTMSIDGETHSSRHRGIGRPRLDDNGPRTGSAESMTDALCQDRQAGLGRSIDVVGPPAAVARASLEFPAPARPNDLAQPRVRPLITIAEAYESIFIPEFRFVAVGHINSRPRPFAKSTRALFV
jgi:hypothetical protein